MTLAQLAAEWKDMAPHVSTLCRLAGDAQTIVEFGVRGGVSTWALLDGLPPDGRMVSVEMVDAFDLPERIAKDPRWRVVWGNDMHTEVQEQLPAAELVLIDTSHEYAHTLAELRLAAHLGAARIALHDWNLEPVRNAVERFLLDSPYRLWLLEPSQWGLAVLAR